MTSNFEINKLNRKGQSQARILQIDCEERVLNNLKKGKVQKSYVFADLQSCEPDARNPLRLFIHFKSRTPYEIFTRSQVDRDALCVKLQSIIDNQIQYDKFVENNRTSSLATVKTGFASKHGKIHWARRRLVLFPDLLTVFRGDKDMAEDIYPLNVISLVDMSVLGKANNILVVKTTMRSYEFKFESEPERDDWFSAISNAIEGLVTKSTHTHTAAAPAVLDVESLTTTVFPGRTDSSSSSTGNLPSTLSTSSSASGKHKNSSIASAVLKATPPPAPSVPASTTTASVNPLAGLEFESYASFQGDAASSTLGSPLPHPLLASTSPLSPPSLQIANTAGEAPKPRSDTTSGRPRPPLPAPYAKAAAPESSADGQLGGSSTISYSFAASTPSSSASQVLVGDSDPFAVSLSSEISLVFGDTPSASAASNPLQTSTASASASSVSLAPPDPAGNGDLRWSFQNFGNSASSLADDGQDALLANIVSTAMSDPFAAFESVVTVDPEQTAFSGEPVAQRVSVSFPAIVPVASVSIQLDPQPAQAILVSARTGLEDAAFSVSDALIAAAEAEAEEALAKLALGTASAFQAATATMAAASAAPSAAVWSSNNASSQTAAAAAVAALHELSLLAATSALAGASAHVAVSPTATSTSPPPLTLSATTNNDTLALLSQPPAHASPSFTPTDPSLASLAAPVPATSTVSLTGDSAAVSIAVSVGGSADTSDAEFARWAAESLGITVPPASEAPPPVRPPRSKTSKAAVVNDAGEEFVQGKARGRSMVGPTPSGGASGTEMANAAESSSELSKLRAASMAATSSAVLDVSVSAKHTHLSAPSSLAPSLSGSATSLATAGLVNVRADVMRTPAVLQQQKAYRASAIFDCDDVDDQMMNKKFNSFHTLFKP